VGDTTSLQATLIAAAQQIEAVQPPTNPTAEIEELVGDKGYHSNDTMTDLQTLEVRTYIAEPERGRRNWTNAPEAQAPVYANRRRVRGARGKHLLRRRGELLERPNAHLYETGGMRRTPLRGHQNIFKRLIVHAAGFNLGLLMRALVGVGKPRRLQGTVSALVFGLRGVAPLITSLWKHDTQRARRIPGLTTIQPWPLSVPPLLAAERTLATDC
jgi:transposase